MVVIGSFRPLSETMISESSSYAVYTLVDYFSRYGSIFGHVGQILAPPVVTKWPTWVIPDHYLRMRSLNLLHRCCITLAMWVFRNDFILATLVKFLPSGGRKMAEIGIFRPLSGILITQPTSSVVHTLIRLVCKLTRFLGHFGQILALCFFIILCKCMMIVCTYTSSWQIRELLQSDLVFYEVDTMMQLAASPIYHAFPLWGLFAADVDGYWWFSEVMSEWSGGNITACSA